MWCLNFRAALVLAGVVFFANALNVRKTITRTHAGAGANGSTQAAEASPPLSTLSTLPEGVTGRLRGSMDTPSFGRLLSTSKEARNDVGVNDERAARHRALPRHVSFRTGFGSGLYGTDWGKWKGSASYAAFDADLKDTVQMPMGNPTENQMVLETVMGYSYLEEGEPFDAYHPDRFGKKVENEADFQEMVEWIYSTDPSTTKVVTVHTRLNRADLGNPTTWRP